MPRCLARFVPLRVGGWWPGGAYVACRLCHRMDGALDPPGGEPRPPGERGGRRRARPRQRPDPFELVGLRIETATEAEVEALCIRCANDDDPVRRAARARALVEIAAGCELSPNARTLLERTFGSLEGA